MTNQKLLSKDEMHIVLCTIHSHKERRGKLQTLIDNILLGQYINMKSHAVEGQEKKRQDCGLSV